MSQQRTPSPDPDGVRIVRERAPLPRAALLLLPVLAFGAVYLLLSPGSPTPVPTESPRTPSGSATPVSMASESTPVDRDSSPTSPAGPQRASAAPTPTPMMAAPSDPIRSAQDNDLARHFRPGDEPPSAAELIQALRDAGETGGIAAFNPPGTSPPLAGLSVPEDFPLPPGYVRHHQWTDDGEPIEPILMFAPDFELQDADGHAVPLPENRVVPPELAPPGLPIRPVEIPVQ